MRHVCMDMCTDMRIDMCIDMCVDMCIDMRMDMCIDMCMDMCIDMCIVSRAYHFWQSVVGLSPVRVGTLWVSSGPEATSKESQSKESYPVATCDARGLPSVPMWLPKGSQLVCTLSTSVPSCVRYMVGHKR